MANITQPKDVRRQEANILHYKVKASEKIPRGALVNIVAGYAKNAADEVGATFVGVASETADNTSGAAGDVEVHVWSYGAIELLAGFSAAQADVGISVTVKDNQTIDKAATTTNDVVVGRIVERLSSSKVRVLLNTGR